MRYKFWLQPLVGPTIEWSGLTLTQAKAMHRNTDKFININPINGYGWELEK